MTPARHGGAPSRLLAAVVVAFAVALLVIQPWRALHDIQDTDFPSYLASAQLLERGDCLYCLDTNRNARAVLLGLPASQGADNPFIAPPTTAAILVPLAGLPLHPALAIFLAAALVATAGSALLLYRRYLADLDRATAMTLLACGLGTLPATQNLAQVQWESFITLAVVAATVIAPKRPWLAGFLLGVGLIKPQLIWLIGPVLLTTAQWRVAAGMVTAGIAWLVANVALVGFHGLALWIPAAIERHGIAQTQNGGVPGLISITGIGGAATTVVMGLLGVAWLVVFNRSRDRLRDHPDLVVALAVGASVASVAYVWTYALALLAPLIVLAGVRRPMVALACALLLDLGATLDLAVPAISDHALPVALAIVSVLAFRTITAPAPRPLGTHATLTA